MWGINRYCIQNGGRNLDKYNFIGPHGWFEVNVACLYLDIINTINKNNKLDWVNKQNSFVVLTNERKIYGFLMQ